MKPTPQFLKAGDVVTLGIDGLGEQKQKIVAFKKLATLLHQAHCVMAGLVPAIHVLEARKAWMPGIKPGMTETATTPTPTASLSTLPTRGRVRKKTSPGR